MGKCQLPKILLVDDHPANLLALSTILKSLDVSLVKALSGKEALVHIDSEEIALVLLDVNMPVLSGYETAMRIQEKVRDLPIVFVTAHDEDVIVPANIYQETISFIFKPIDPKLLTDRVKSLIKGG